MLGRRKRGTLISFCVPYIVLGFRHFYGNCVKVGDIFAKRGNVLVCWVACFLQIIFVLLLAEENGVKSTIPDKPIDLKNYTKLCDLRRKFQVLYKVEFQVSFIFVSLLLSAHSFVLRSTSLAHKYMSSVR